MKEGETYWFLDEPYHRAGVERRAVRARVVEVVGKFVRLRAQHSGKTYLRLPEELHKNKNDL